MFLRGVKKSENQSMKKCHCGKKLHYTDLKTKKFVLKMIKKLGEYIRVTNSDGITFRVQRHYLALHGLKEEELEKLGFEKIHREVI
jgi:hypothetical protein